MENLKKIRKVYNLTQEDVADKLNIARTTYQSYENDSNKMNYEMLKKLSKLFNISIDFLLENVCENKLDITSLTAEQKELVDLIQKLNQDNCRLLNAYANGLMEAQKKQDEIIKKFTNVN